MSASLDLKRASWIRVEDSSVLPGYVRIAVRYMDIRVVDGPTEYVADTPSNFYFTFRPVVGDSTWEIVNWKEVRTQL